jgi:hypothetical protein
MIAALAPLRTASSPHNRIRRAPQQRQIAEEARTFVEEVEIVVPFHAPPNALCNSRGRKTSFAFAARFNTVAEVLAKLLQLGRAMSSCMATREVQSAC